MINDCWRSETVFIGFWATLIATVLGTFAAIGLSNPVMLWQRTIMAILLSLMIAP